MPSEPSFRNVLCIRADNMGDVIMSSPAMRALKQTFGCRLTLLTSRAGSLIVPYLDCVDELIIMDLPWVKTLNSSSVGLQELAAEIASRQFDAAIIFTVYSQSALPAAMLTYMAGIPLRIAYARENPYDLLTTWLPDHEPYDRILHQVERDLELVKAAGAVPGALPFVFRRNRSDQDSARQKLAGMNVELDASFLILHPGVSEDKRKYPVGLWIETGQMLSEKLHIPLLISGSAGERDVAEEIAAGIGEMAFNVAGQMSLGEFIEIVGCAACVVSVNTSTIHIAAAVQTPVVVLYAETNPQHTPWQSPHEILRFSVPKELQSRNPIIRHVAARIYNKAIPYPAPDRVASAVERLMAGMEIAKRGEAF